MIAKIVVKAGNEHGHEISKKKAETIVSTNGFVTVVAVDEAGRPIFGLDASIRGGSFVTGYKPATVSWGGLSGVEPERAAIQAEVIYTAQRIAAKANASPSEWFKYVPKWVETRLAGTEWSQELVCYWAAVRYHNGDANYHEAWEWAIRKAKEEAAQKGGE